MEPTPQQLANQMNPTPFAVQNPNEGLFKAVGDYGTTLYKRSGNQVTQINLLDENLIKSLFNQNELNNYALPGGTLRQQKNAGDVAGDVINRLQERYGIDWAKIPAINFGDTMQSWNANPASKPIFRVSNNLQDIIGAPMATLTSEMKNTTLNKLAPAEVRKAAETVGAPITTGQQVMAGTNLGGISGEKSNQTMKDFNQLMVNAPKGVSKEILQAAASALQSGAFTYDQALNFLNENVKLQKEEYKPSVTITSEGLKTEKPYDIASTLSSGGTTNADNLIAGVKSVYDEELKKAKEEQTKTQTSYDTLSDKLNSLLEGSTGRGSAQLTAETTYQVAEKKRLYDIETGKIKTALAEYNQMKANYDAFSIENRNKPITMNSIIGNEAQINFAKQADLNRKAAEIGMLQAGASILQQDYQTAQGLADRSVDLKYQDQKDLLDVRLKQLDLIRDDLTIKQKETADLLEKQYQTQKDAIEEKRSLEKAEYSQKLSIMNEYMDAGWLPNDINLSLAELTNKASRNSEIYKKQVRPVGGSDNKSQVTTLAPEDRRVLVGAGFNDSDITNIQSDINQYGIDAVLNNIPDQNQKSALEKVYGVKTKISKEQINATITQKIAQDELKKLYTQEELEKLAKDNGFASIWKKRATEVENFLNSDKAKQVYVDYLYKQYQAAGMAI